MQVWHFCVLVLLRLSVSTIVNNKCTTFQMWIILTWGYILINGFFISEQYFGWKSIFVYLLPALAIMLFYAPFRDKDLIFDIFCKGCEFGAVVSIIYIVINELPTILAGSARIGWSASGNVNTVAMNLSVFALVIYYEILFEQKKSYTFICDLRTIYPSYRLKEGSNGNSTSNYSAEYIQI